MRQKILSLIAFLCLVLPVFAQTEESVPLIAFFNDELYQLEGTTLVPYTACTPDEKVQGQFIPNNTGSAFLMLTFPRVISQALEQFGTLGDIAYGPNIWLCDTSTDSLTRILAQPNADTAFDGELPSSEIIQSRPAWSPDGSQIAWTQLNYLESLQSLVIYDVATAEMHETALDLPLSAFPSPPETLWTASGILLFVYTLDEVTFLNVEILYKVDAATGAITNSLQIFSGGETSDFISERAIVQQDSGELLALHYYEAGWVLLNLETGEEQAVRGQLQAFSASNPDGIRLNYDLNPQYSYDWEILTTAIAEAVPLTNYPAQRVALSPDGTQVAYADAVLHLYQQNGQVVDVANSDGFADDALAIVLWGTSEQTFVISEESPATFVCEGAPDSHLIVGRQARVIEATIPNNVRREPTTSAELLGQIPGGSSFDVVGGPICADGYVWYQIQFEAINGWTVEGNAALYFLEPLP